LHPETHQRGLVRRSRILLPRMLRRAAQIITVSESVKQEICDHFHVAPDKVTVTPNAPRKIFSPMKDTRDILRRLGVEDEFILFVGTIEPRKNLAILIKAFEELLRTTSQSPQLVIDGPR